MPFPRWSQWGKIRLFVTIVIALLFILGSVMKAAADDEDWSEFGFDTSSDSYKVKGQRAYDLRYGRYAASEYRRTHDGDFIIMTGFNPQWVTFRTIDWQKVLFSTSEESDSKIDEKVERVPNCVPVHYGDSYVVSFDERTYTIKLVEGSYEFPVGIAKFVYQPGGTPGPEHEPRKPSARMREITPESESSSSAEVEMDPSKGHFYMRIEERDTITFGTPRPFTCLDPSPAYREAGWIYKLRIAVITGSAEDASVDKADLRVDITGPAHFHKVNTGVRPDRKQTFTFCNIPAGTYGVEVTWGDDAITDTVNVDEDTPEINLSFGGEDYFAKSYSERRRDEQARSRSRRPDDTEDDGPCPSRCTGVDGSGRRRPIDKRGPSEPIEGYVRFIYVCVTMPSAEDAAMEEADLSVELRGSKHFRLTRKKIRPGTTKTLKFLTLPVGTYEIIAKYGDQTTTETMDLRDDCHDFWLVFE